MNPTRLLEADTVAHCGSSTEGMFANTLDCVDIATAGRNACRLGQKHQGVIDQIKDIGTSPAVPDPGFDADNGSES